MINEFEHFLLERFRDENGVRFNNLLEWRGYNLDFEWMVDEIYRSICENRFWVNPTGFFSKKYIEHDFQGKCFLGNVKVIFGLNTNRSKNAIHQCVSDINDSYLSVVTSNGEKKVFNPEKDANVEDEKIVLDNCLISIELSSKTRMIPEYEFKSSFWHELMHLYQYYSELVKNKGVLPTYVKLNNIKYSKATAGLIAYSKNNDPVLKKICALLYRFDQDEVNANMSMIYPFLEVNRGITFSNIKEYLPYLEIYKTITLANEVKEMLEKIIKNKEEKEKVDDALCDIFSHLYKKDQCSKLLLKYVIRMIPYLQDKTYRNIRSALEKLNRPTPLNEISSKLSYLS